MQVDVEVVPAAAGVLSKKACSVRLVDRLIQNDSLVEVFATNVNVCRASAHCVTSEEASLHKLVRVLPHDLAVLAGTRFGFVCVDHQERRAAVRSLGHEGPLETARESGSATASEARVLDLLHHPVRAHPHDILGAVPVSAEHCVLKTPVLLAVDVGEDAVGVLEPAVLHFDVGTRGRVGRQSPCSRPKHGRSAEAPHRCSAQHQHDRALTLHACSTTSR
mmetsp:Transcript_19033/g.34542  ORF Transcript_19033/g.34542 Transcript_19033/m.34542 type:complete len:220 (+) Transcript_19033:994-1653(+)